MKDWLSKFLIYLILFTLSTGCVPDVYGKDRQEIVVFAAASLTESFQAIEEAYEEENPEIDVVLNFAGSQILYNQIKAGGDADLYFSANMLYPEKLVDESVDGCRSVDSFGQNRLMVIGDSFVEETFDAWISSMRNIPVKLVLALDTVPVGAYTEDMMNRYLFLTGESGNHENFYDQVVSYETDVKNIVAKVMMGEADFGIVYTSDYLAVSDKGKVEGLMIPEDYNVSAEYGSIRITDDEETESFYTFILEGKGNEILRSYGF